MKGGWQGPLLFCPPQICSRPSTKSASKLGVAQTRPNRAKSRNAGVVSRVTTTAAAAALQDFPLDQEIAPFDIG